MAACFFCKGESDWNGVANRTSHAVNCQICGRYELDELLKLTVTPPATVNAHLVNCIAENIAAAESGLKPFWCSSLPTRAALPDEVYKVFPDYAKIPIGHANKSNELLRIFAEKLRGLNPFQKIQITVRDAYSIKINGYPELAVWLLSLLGEESIETDVNAFDTMSPNNRISILSHSTAPATFGVTPAGWRKIEQMFASINSKQAFIAMSFKHKNRKEIQGAITAACANTGWAAKTVDGTHFITGITDEIIAMINRSRFVVADFSENKHGVYFEAGYAAGRGIPVIYAVNEKEMKKVHFDTRHINHITWSSFEDLQKQLTDRIGAVINR